MVGPFRASSRELPSRNHIDDSGTLDSLSATLRSLLTCDLTMPPCRPVLFFCVGTDRSTGDALGPLTGTRLVGLGIEEAYVWGTLDSPVHAANLQNAIEKAYVSFADPYIIAVDACLGRLENVGTVTASRGPLRPGTGVSKSLPSIGDIHVTGIVNVGGYMEYLVLQNTRLSLVMRMAETIARALILAARDYLSTLHDNRTIGLIAGLERD